MKVVVVVRGGEGGGGGGWSMKTNAMKYIALS